MILPKFDFQRPPTLPEASALLHEHGKHALASAGGTDLIPRMKYGLADCRLLVSLRGVAVKEPRLDDEGNLQLDALMTLADLLASPLAAKAQPALLEAASEVASNQVRHMGTIGGNLCQESRCLYYNQSHAYQFVEPCLKRSGERCYFIPKAKKCWAVFMSDLATALLALDASVEVMGAQGTRDMKLQKLYSGDSMTPLTLQPGELLSTLTIPAPPPGFGAAFGKFAMRGGVEFAGVNVAVGLQTKDNGKTCSKARIVCGAISGGPLRLTSAETLLSSKTLTLDLLELAAKEAAAWLNPYPHHDYSAGYLKAVLKEETHQALVLAAQRATA